MFSRLTSSNHLKVTPLFTDTFFVVQIGTVQGQCYHSTENDKAGVNWKLVTWTRREGRFIWEVTGRAQLHPLGLLYTSLLGVRQTFTTKPIDLLELVSQGEEGLWELVELNLKYIESCYPCWCHNMQAV